MHPDPAVLARAAEALKAGEIVVAPSETRYGLLARADSESAVKKLCRAKGRDFDQAVAVFVDSPERLGQVGDISGLAVVLAETFLPGPMTMVVGSRVDWPSPVVVDGKIGLRLSSAHVIMGLLNLTGFALTATSANLSGSRELTTIDDIETQLGDSVFLYLDAGELVNPVSTVVECTSEGYRVIREGAIAAVDIEAATERASN